MNKQILLTCAALVFASLTPVQAKDKSSGGGNYTQAVINQINRVRTNPQAYADYLEKHRAYYTADNMFKAPGRTALRTREGVAALDNAIRTLRRTSPQTPITALDLLMGPGRELINNQQQNGQIGHGSEAFDRFSRHGQWQTRVGENVAYGAPSPEQIVYNLVVDDGVRDRGHLKNILQPEFRLAGVTAGSHPVYGSMCVIDFASDYRSK